jgi:leader peptidase (prepilin peptidase)/N-methyltransferase
MAFLDLLQSNVIVFYGVVAFISLLVGSFLNVVIHRLPIMMENEWRTALQELDEEVIGELAAAGGPADATVTATTPETFNLSVPRSHCPKCDNQITWWQNIPVISYLMLRGRCYNCKTSISARYPVIELITMLLSIAVAWQFGASWQSVVGISVTWLLVAMTMIDFDHQLLPDNLTLPMMWIGLLASLVPVFADVRSAVIGAAAGYLILWTIYQLFKLITGKEGMGYGDFKLLAAIGALLGWEVLPMVILLSSLVGAVVGVSLILVSGRDKNIPIPFGPYLAAAGWIAMMWGEPLGRMYFGLFA